MKYKIDQIEGIGETYCHELAVAGVRTTEDLLGKAGTVRGRRDLASYTNIPERLILKWTNQADLMRISGVGSEYAELLEAAGVDTVKELGQRNPDSLATRMVEVQQETRLTRMAPPASIVRRWIEQARDMESRVSY